MSHAYHILLVSPAPTPQGSPGRAWESGRPLSPSTSGHQSCHSNLPLLPMPADLALQSGLGRSLPTGHHVTRVSLGKPCTACGTKPWLLNTALKALPCAFHPPLHSTLAVFCLYIQVPTTTHSVLFPTRAMWLLAPLISLTLYPGHASPTTFAGSVLLSF